jgi:hypothetical protein
VAFVPRYDRPDSQVADSGSDRRTLKKKMSPDAVQDMLYEHSGLLGMFGVSSDMQELLRAEERRPEIAEAIDFYCARARAHVSALAAALGGVDRLVFTAGIGANAPEIRARMCARLHRSGGRVRLADCWKEAPERPLRLTPFSQPVRKRAPECRDRDEHGDQQEPDHHLNYVEVGRVPSNEPAGDDGRQRQYDAPNPSNHLPFPFAVGD